MSSTDQNDTASENELPNRIALALAVAGPAGWQRIDAAFLSASADAGRVVVFDGKGQAMPAKYIEGLRELIARAQTVEAVRSGVMAETYYGLLVGLSAAISAGSPWQIAAEVIVSGLRPPSGTINGDAPSST
ncbi:hypothetical protein ACIBG0_41755 [Nocardia sp. NPDC050630]|uniref:hypothetical protein n=1 Tax=Nocardia sp. NPDC050630 TaxID=3364321 RepID=UPI003788B79A